ncbi:hypothetical protein GCM10017673_39480 [Streptosporangium violaceochromogenes]|nr:hypothetical protein GCM10017673_39480 [Streptosporangium violaceochromogenes]
MLKKLGVAAAALTMAAGVLTATTFLAPEPASAGICPAGAVCLWENNDFQPGCSMVWRPSNGSRILPSCLRDDVGSFTANAEACFVDTYPGGVRESHRARPGDYSRAYSHGDKFGGRMDRIDPGQC